MQATLRLMNELAKGRKSGEEKDWMRLEIASRMTKRLRILQNLAQAGASLSSIADIESEYRFNV